MDETVRDRRPQRALRMHALEGLLRVLDDPHRFLDVVLSAKDETVAEAALQEQFGLSPDQARWAMNLQVRSMPESARQAIREEAESLRD
jgi:DNA gyrase/topoisomerase IV subunit A